MKILKLYVIIVMILMVQMVDAVLLQIKKEKEKLLLIKLIIILKIYLLNVVRNQKKISHIIFEKLKFSNYDSTERDSGFIEYEEKIEIRNLLYDSCRVNELLKYKKIKNIYEILKFAFYNQKGNKLLIITFLTAKKINRK